jgi:tetratricopeptide (TPR) repeat protein
LPAAVLTEVVAALDEWAAERRRAGQAADAQRLADLAAALDDAPDSARRKLHDRLDGRDPARERALVTLLAALRPVPVPFDPGPLDVLERLRGLAAETDVTREPVLGLLTLARALREAGDDSAAEDLLRSAVKAPRPPQAVLHDALARLLEEQQPPHWPKAVEHYVTARSLRHELGEALALALVNSGRAGEGLVVYDELLGQRPEDAGLHFRRGDALRALGRHAEAATAYGEALRLRPEFPEALNHLGLALFKQDRYEEAMAQYAAALDQRPAYAEAHYNLGKVLLDQRRYEDAVAEYRQALRLDPDYLEAHLNLGRTCLYQERYAEAASACRDALRIKPDWSGAHNNLGIAQFKQSRYEEARTAFRAALLWNPRYPGAHYNIGNTLLEQKRYREAEEEYRAALVLRPDHAETLCNLGLALQGQGRFATALEYLEKGHELGRRIRGWDYESADWVRDCREWLRLDARLSAILDGVAKSAGPDEGVALASLCWQYKQLYGTAARLYEAAFDAKPQLAAEMREEKEHRYHAARSAVLAAARGQGDRELPDEVRRMRQRGRKWLGAQLALYEVLVKVLGNIVRGEVRSRLARWQKEPDLASVRDPAALDQLPDDERQAWRQLWDEVAALLRKVEATK